MSGQLQGGLVDTLKGCCESGLAGLLIRQLFIHFRCVANIKMQVGGLGQLQSKWQLGKTLLLDNLQP